MANPVQNNRHHVGAYVPVSAKKVGNEGATARISVMSLITLCLLVVPLMLGVIASVLFRLSLADLAKFDFGTLGVMMSALGLIMFTLWFIVARHIVDYGHARNKVPSMVVLGITWAALSGLAMWAAITAFMKQHANAADGSREEDTNRSRLVAGITTLAIWAAVTGYVAFSYYRDLRKHEGDGAGSETITSRHLTNDREVMPLLNLASIVMVFQMIGTAFAVTTMYRTTGDPRLTHDIFNSVFFLGAWAIISALVGVYSVSTVNNMFLVVGYKKVSLAEAKSNAHARIFVEALPRLRDESTPYIRGSELYSKMVHGKYYFYYSVLTMTLLAILVTLLVLGLMAFSALIGAQDVVEHYNFPHMVIGFGSTFSALSGIAALAYWKVYSYSESVKVTDGGEEHDLHIGINGNANGQVNSLFTNTMLVMLLSIVTLGQVVITRTDGYNTGDLTKAAARTRVGMQLLTALLPITFGIMAKLFYHAIGMIFNTEVTYAHDGSADAGAGPLDIKKMISVAYSLRALLILGALAVLMFIGLDVYTNIGIMDYSAWLHYAALTFIFVTGIAALVLTFFSSYTNTKINEMIPLTRAAAGALASLLFVYIAIKFIYPACSPENDFFTKSTTVFELKALTFCSAVGGSLTAIMSVSFLTVAMMIFGAVYTSYHEHQGDKVQQR